MSKRLIQEIKLAFGSPGPYLSLFYWGVLYLLAHSEMKKSFELYCDDFGHGKRCGAVQAAAVGELGYCWQHH